MSRSDTPGLSTAPMFRAHRVAVKAADPTLDSTHPTMAMGVPGDEFQNIIADVKLDGTNVTVECLYWSDLSAQFLHANPPETKTLTASGQLRFNNGGRRFFLYCTGTFTQVDIDVAGTL